MIIIVIILILLICVIEYCFLKKVNFHRLMYPKYYQEVTFDLNPEQYNQEVSERIKKGKQIAQDKTIVICSLARNIESRLKKNIPLLEYVGKQFKNYQIVIFENDSDDRTRDLIKSWSKHNKHIKLLDCCHLGDCDCRLNESKMYDLGAMTNKRINKMAFFRNQYLDYVKKNLSHYDYMLVIDLDIEGTISMDGIFHSISHEPNWDMISINGRCQFPATFGMVTNAYDGLAYYPDTRSEIKDQSANWFEWFYRWLDMNIKIKQNHNQIFKVKSAFNGAALYRVSSILKSQYSCIASCEHIGLHMDMIKQGHSKIYLNPVWLGYIGYQGPRDNLLSFFKSTFSS